MPRIWAYCRPPFLPATQGDAARLCMARRGAIRSTQNICKWAVWQYFFLCVPLRVQQVSALYHYRSTATAHRGMAGPFLC